MSVWLYSGDGDSFRFWICKCGAAVPTSEKERHEKWHKEHNW